MKAYLRRPLQLAMSMMCVLATALPLLAQDPVDRAVGEHVGDVEEQALVERIRPFRKNYFLVVHNPTLSGLRPAGGGKDQNSDQEIEFQLSIRTLLLNDVLQDDWTLNFGYTGKSFWQTWASSSPFRTTDHAAELFWESGQEFGGNWILRASPLLHQSNGESGARSRSWNRSYVEANWYSDESAAERALRGSFSRGGPESGLLKLGLMVWEGWNIDADFNPDILEYYGRFELSADWHTGAWRNSTFSTMLRNNLRSGTDNRTTVGLQWSLDLTEQARILVQFFSGYGLNLLDYDVHQQSLGIGFELSP